MGAVIRFGGDGFKAYSMQLERFANNLSDAEPLFQALADVVADANEQQFKTIGAHYGAQWKPLSPKYAAWKAKNFPGAPLMVRTGLLKESLTKRPFGIEEITSKKMVVGTGVSYASFHQKGNPDTGLPARPLIGRPARPDQKKLSSALHSWAVKGEVSI